MRRLVLRHVHLAAVHRHLALAAAGQGSSLARWVAAGPSQLVAETLVLEHVQDGVALVAVQRDPAPWTFVQGRAVFRLDLARRVLALSDLSLRILGIFDKSGNRFLGSERDELMIKDNRGFKIQNGLRLSIEGRTYTYLISFWHDRKAFLVLACSSVHDEQFDALTLFAHSSIVQRSKALTILPVDIGFSSD